MKFLWGKFELAKLDIYHLPFCMAKQKRNLHILATDGNAMAGFSDM